MSNLKCIMQKNGNKGHNMLHKVFGYRTHHLLRKKCLYTAENNM